MHKLSLLSVLILPFFVGCHSPKDIPSPLPSIDTSKVTNMIDTTQIKSIFGANVKKEYYTGGKVRSAFVMSDKSGQNGLLKKYGYSGKLTSTVTIRNSLMHGVETLFDQQGRVIKRTSYYNGKKEGLLTAYYPNGSTMANINFMNNLKHGRAVKYNSDGSVNQQVMFHNGRLAN